MIVKIQRSLSHGSTGSTMLVYNKSRSILQECPLTKEVSDLLGSGYKGYFHAQVKKGQLVIRGKAPNQNW